jgi:hypothetical protein
MALSLMIQATGFSLPENSALNAKEKLKIEKELKIENRIKIYRQASERIQKNIENAVRNEKYQTLPTDLKLWASLLDESLEDIRANLRTKKKSKNLIRFEIQVRKAISDSEGYKLKAPIEMQDLFNSCLDKAEKIRQAFVDILFKTNK